VTDGLSRIERMLIEHECAQLVRHSLNLSDARAYDRLVDLFTEDAVMIRPSMPDCPLMGRVAIAADYAARPTDRLTFHICSNVVITALSQTRAEAYCHVLLYSAVDDPASDVLPTAAPAQFAGAYQDVLVRQDEGWRFQARTGRMILRTWHPPVGQNRPQAT